MTDSRPNIKVAKLLNFVLPGAGFFCLGRWKLGVLFSAAFLCCLAVAAGIFLVGYVDYFRLALDPDLLQPGHLEAIRKVFHPRWLVGLAIGGVVIYLVSAIALSWLEARSAKPPPLPGPDGGGQGRVRFDQKELPEERGPTNA